MDVSDEKAFGTIDSSADPGSRDCEISGSNGLKSCADCGTTKTPLWRCGPSGPKSLCNACGIRYRKKRRPLAGLKERDMAGERYRKGSGRDRREDKRDRNNNRMERLKMSVMGFRREVFWKLDSLTRKQNRRRLGEEEEAAILLMAISSGLVYG